MKIKKFKHKKTGHIFEQDGSYYNRPKHEHIPAWLVEGSNDWEEIIEKDYEILSYIDKANNGVIYKLDTQLKDLYCIIDGKAPFFTKEQLQYCYIHSVKRLSDDEIFTIGDKCNLKNGNGYQNAIIKIELTKNGISGHFEKYRNKETIKITLNTGFQNIILWGPFELDNIVKSKQPLFTTEDGVDIFEGESYYELITPDFHNKPCIWNILPTKTRGNINYDQEGNRRNGRIWFSTKEKAEEYIDLNKPKYSLNDILSVAKDYYVMPQSFIDKLKQLNK